jgi:hypothetical protein
LGAVKEVQKQPVLGYRQGDFWFCGRVAWENWVDFPNVLNIRLFFPLLRIIQTVLSLNTSRNVSTAFFTRLFVLTGAAVCRTGPLYLVVPFIHIVAKT